MARRYYRRRTVTVRPKKKWASNMQIIRQTFSGTGLLIDLCSNSSSTSSPTPVILKTGNYKLRLDSQVSFGGSAIEWWPGLNFFVMYVPEGIAITSTPSRADINTFVTKHPEWLICSGVAGSNTVNASKFDLETVSFSSRLKRNLNSGDRVVLLCAANDGADSLTINLRGTVRFWTCSN